MLCNLRFISVDCNQRKLTEKENEQVNEWNNELPNTKEVHIRDYYKVDTLQYIKACLKKNRGAQMNLEKIKFS